MKNVKIFTIVLIQICIFIYIASHKYGYHSDELWTYNIANCEKILADKSIPFASFVDKQIDKIVFRNLYKAEASSLFNFSKPWNNTHLDPHPPLYYCVVHFVTCIFSYIDDNINVYIGIIPNIIFFIMIQFFVFYTSKELTNNDTVGFFSIVLYGFSLGCIDSILMIRMYSMVTMFVCLFFYLHIIESRRAICTEAINNKFLIYSYFVFIFGFLTHLYFIIIAFFIAIFFFCLKIIKKFYKDALKYAGVMLLSLASSIFLCQDILSKIFGTNIHTAHISKSFETADFFKNFYEWLFIVDKYTYFIDSLIIVALYILATSLFKSTIKGNFKTSFLNLINVSTEINLYIRPLSLYSIFVVLFTVAIISKITLYASSRYIIFLTPLCCIFISIIFYDNIFNRVNNKKILISIIFCAMMSTNIVKYKDIMWLNFEQKNVLDVIHGDKCPDKMLVIVKRNIGYEGGGEAWWPTITATQLSLYINKTYITFSDNIDNIKNLYKNDNSLLLYIDSRIDKTLSEKIINSLNFQNAKFLHEFNQHQGNIYFLFKS